MDKECAEKWRNSNTVNSNWFYKLGFRNRLQAIVMLISCPAWVRPLSMTGVKVEGDSLGWVFGPKRSTYTRVNAVVVFAICCIKSFIHTHSTAKAQDSVPAVCADLVSLFLEMWCFLGSKGNCILFLLSHSRTKVVYYQWLLTLSE